MGRVSGKVAIVTGSAAGIGRATAQALAREGAHVVIADLNLDGAKQTAEKIGEAATPFQFDATKQETIAELVDFTMKRHGRIDILHNNAALVGPDAWFTDGSVLSTSVEMWDRAFATNVRSIFLACKFALPHMVAGGGGAIVNMASVGGLSGGKALTAYGTTKAAVVGLTRYIAAQHGKDGVRCNAIAPGVIRTRQLLDAVPDLPQQTLPSIATPRVGEPEDIANLVVYLASDESAFMTGETLRIDGGGMTTTSGG
ncbi:MULTISPECIES: SDR family NAD(P)-dependent oxidoreductase [unclassified Streptomyces]|uniref:SDR family NAD(P)-dependent oxidoreductase n=1 Tax=unclassified Streptomyces TaxID=2593676 RepID=UPI003D9110AD